MASFDEAARQLWGPFAKKRVYRMLPGVPTPIGVRPLHLTMVREIVEETYDTVENRLDHDVALARRFTSRSSSLSQAR